MLSRGVVHRFAAIKFDSAVQTVKSLTSSYSSFSKAVTAAKQVIDETAWCLETIVWRQMLAALLHELRFEVRLVVVRCFVSCDVYSLARIHHRLLNRVAAWCRTRSRQQQVPESWRATTS